MILRRFLHTDPVAASTAEGGARALPAGAGRRRTLADHVVVPPGAFSPALRGAR